MAVIQSDYPPSTAIDQFLSATTLHTRRVEIYEQDGITRWVKDTVGRLKDGSVNVDYSRDERRTLDLVLDNTDGVLLNAAGEFWYDKIIKVFRGVAVEETTRPPKILILSDAAGGASMAAAFRAILVSAGYGDAQVNVLASSTADVLPYDIIVGLTGASGTQITTMVTAYRAGKSVLVFDADAVLWAAQAVTGETSGTYSPGGPITPIPNLAHPVAQGWSAFTLLGSTVDSDTFARVASSTWGTADLGGAWSNAFSAGGASSDFSTNGYGEHLIIVAAAIARESKLTTVSVQDMDVTYDIQCNQVPAQRMDCSFLGRFVDTNNNYLCMTQFTTAGNIDLVISRRNSGTVTTMVTATSAVATFSTTAWYRVRFRLVGTSLKSKIWLVGTAEPATWTLSTTDGSVTSSAGVAFRTIPAATTTVAGLAIRFDNLVVTNETGTPGDTTVYGYAAVSSDTVTPIALVASDATKARVAALEDPGSGGRAVVVSAAINNAQLAKTEFANLIASATRWLNTVVLVDAWETQIGEFMIDRISEPHFPHEVRVTGRDYTKKCMASKFEEATDFAAGYSLEALISSLASNAGIVKKQLPVTGVTVSKAFHFERHYARWDAMKEIAKAYNYALFFSPTGYLVMEKFSDPSLDAPILYIQTGTTGQIATYEKTTTDTRIYNSILISGESSDTTIPNVFASAKNTNPTSPTSIDELGERSYTYTSSFFTTTQQCQDYANTLLAIHSLEEFELNFETLVLPWLDVGQILGFVDPSPAPGDPTTFLLTGITLPLKLGPMSGNARRTTIVG